MVSFRKSQNYLHSSLLDADGVYRPKSILVVGSTGSGKSIYVEDAVEEIEDNMKNCISIFLVDAVDTLEGAFALFPATEKHHIKKLDFQMEEPKGRDTKLWTFFGRNFKQWGKKLPEMEVVTLGVKSVLQREECLFLLETEKENKAIRVLMACGEELKNSEGLIFLKHYGKKLTKRKQVFYRGKAIGSEDEPVGDAKDFSDILAVLNPFDDGLIMPEEFKHNFDVKKMLKEPKRHIFIYRGLKKDEKIRDFVFFHILNQIARNITDCKYPVNIIIEEAQSKAPFKGQGHKAVLSAKMGDLVGTLRKTGRGVSLFMVGRSWSRIAEEVRTECRKQIIFHLEQDDMLKYVKSRSLTGRMKLNIEKLGTGEYVHKGEELRICWSKMPRHSHKHPQLQFIELYKQFFPKKLMSYNEVIKEIEDEYLRQDRRFEVVLKEERHKKKMQIKREMDSKAREKKGDEELLKYKEEENARKKEEKKKRDAKIIEVFHELNAKGEKVSYRIIAKRVTELGIKTSFMTVKNVLSDFQSSEGDVEKTVM